ncbi:hypothetical protein KSC_089650 [Ktedonobacter sp. SOSP1-52]|uniref:sensor histidine kinase n=1 Tax=Ktedonobacter sp. SOSP1-52 TaxID=2778366 RepID=UPI0019151B88|nr:ATP-binding protein [Ktedonobacter sp. SOSP1-52]GHO70073.1 hypothetical protein KSC_089650 [Ktedonobacter sp. SOSP1-52]
MDKTKISYFLTHRWLVILCGLTIQVFVIILAYTNSFQPAQSDITLVPVAGRSDVCRIVHVSMFTDAWINGIEPGMLVHAISAPFPVDHSEAGTLVHCQPTASSIYVQVIGHNIVLHLNSAISTYPLSSLVVSCFMAIIFSLTGITIYLRATDRPAARMAYGLFYCASYLFFLMNAQSQLWTNIVFYILGSMTWGMAATFVCLLPRIPSGQKYRMLPLLPYTPLIIGLVLIACDLPIILFLPWARSMAALIIGIYAGVCVLIIGGIMFWGLRHLSSSEKQISRLMIAGVAFFLLAQALRHNVIIPNSFVLNSFTHLLPAPLMLLPILCGYSLIRHQFLGLTSLLSRQVMRVLMWLMLACFFLVPTIMLIETIQNSIASQIVQDYCYAGLLIVNLCLFPQAWHAIRNLGDQVFYHDFYEYNRSLRELSAELTRLQHFDQICAFILPRLARLLNATGVALLVRTQGHATTSADHKYLVLPWHIYLNTEPPFLAGERLAAIANLALTHIRPHTDEPLLLDGVLLLALSDGDTLNGFLCLGPKQNYEPYSRQDKSFLATLAAQLSVLEVNSRYLEQTQANARQLTALNRRVISAQEDERRHVALELHDEVLQQALLLVRQLSDASITNDVSAPLPLARSLVSSLRRTCLELRPPLLDDLGLEEALRWLAQQTEQRTKFLQITVFCTRTDNTRLPSEVELAFYRIAQEAFSNVTKHAQASRVMLRLRSTSMGGTSLLIYDNGRGFLKGKPEHEQLGLIGMHERMIAVGGQLQLRTQPGRGVIVRATYRSQSILETLSQRDDAFTSLERA